MGREGILEQIAVSDLMPGQIVDRLPRKGRDPPHFQIRRLSASPGRPQPAARLGTGRGRASRPAARYAPAVFVVQASRLRVQPRRLHDNRAPAAGRSVVIDVLPSSVLQPPQNDQAQGPARSRGLDGPRRHAPMQGKIQRYGCAGSSGAH